MRWSIADRRSCARSSKTNPELVQLDLGQAWLDLTGQPMVFGVFAARKDTPVEVVQAAHQALLKRLDAFEKDPLTREGTPPRSPSFRYVT